MTAGFGYCRRPFVGALALGLFAYGVSVQGQEIRLQPVTADGNVHALPDPADCDDSEIILTAGGVQVTLFIELSGWDSIGGGHPGDTGWYLGGPQGTIDSATYLGGAPGNPGTIVGYDLTAEGWSAGTPTDGAFMALKVCGTLPCVIGPPEDCFWDPLSSGAPCPPAFPAEIDRPDYVFAGLEHTPGVSVSSPDYAYFAASPDCREDPRVHRCDASGVVCRPDYACHKDATPCDPWGTPCANLGFHCLSDDLIVCSGLGDTSCPDVAGDPDPCVDNEQDCMEVLGSTGDCGADGPCLPEPANCVRFYMGTLPLNVPTGAKGSYNVNYINDPNFTMFNSCPGPPIPGLIRKAGTITIRTGQCCYGIGTVDEDCGDDMTQNACDAMPPPRLPIVPGGVCGVDDCCECLSDGDCDDGNACTDDTCFNCGCSSTDNYDPTVVCCDPAGSGNTTILDDYVCTDDICDPLTGIVTHPPLKDDHCTVADAVHDGFPEQADCYYDFKCENDGLCHGTDINLVECPNGPEQDCPEGTTECELGYCLCEVCSTLVLDVVAGARGAIDPNCFGLGEDVVINVAVVGGSKTLIGGQFLINYDPDCLEFVDSQSGSPWEVIMFSDDPAGTIFFVALDQTQNGGAPVGVFAQLHFKKKAGCTACDLCFDSINPQNTILSDDKGNAVIICNPNDCSKEVKLRGDITVSGPAGAEVNADCGATTSLQTWDTPTAADSCEGVTPVICNGAYVHNVGDPAPTQATIDALIMNGGVFTQGRWFFECHAQNTCGGTDRYVWSVNVSDQNAMDVEVHLGQPFVASAISRCICFELWAECFKDPEEICTVIDFGPPYNFKGHGVASLKIDKNNYDCVSAFDPYHTLRATAIPECVGNAWSVVFKGDPWLGGNWLIGGNLDYIKPDGGNGPDTIDVRDFGKFIVDLKSTYTDGSTTCSTAEPHADINGDGLVDNIDFSIIQMNFMKASKITCCDKPEAMPTPLTEISVKDLRLMGLGDLIIADLNQDGFLNMDDMNEYQNGVVPVGNEIHRKRGTR